MKTQGMGLAVNTMYAIYYTRNLGLGQGLG